MYIQRPKQSFRQNFNDLLSGKVPFLTALKWFAISIGILIAGSIILLVILIAILSIGLPDVHNLDKLMGAQSTTIYDREGNVLYVKHGGENRQYVTYEQISKNIVDATVSIEDEQFWTHSGFNPIGILRATLSNVTNLRASQGGSTITQQYVKNTFLSSEKSIIRKLKELILAVELEQTYDKKKIMEMYLNKIPYGNNAYGVEKATQTYFNKHAKDLDLAESTILASLPKSPSHYNPYGPRLYSQVTKQFTPDELQQRKITQESDLNPDEYDMGLIGKNIKLDDTHFAYIQGRTDLVLKSMSKLGYITDQQKNSALKELQSIKINEYHDQIKHPHFVFYILDQLEQKYGKELVESGGLKVYTTLDPKLQDFAEQAVADGAKTNEQKFNAKNAALVAIDPKTGQVLSMVGSRYYWDKNIDGAVNVADQYRQPGSSFKPFVYSQLFLNRYSPATVVFDTDLHFPNGNSPKNFDGKFWGPMPIRRALGQSRNIPAIKSYFLGGGQEPIKQLAEKMGIHFDPRTRDSDDGWTLALGAKDVKLIDMVSAFGVFANSGIRHEPVTILKVESAGGDILEQWQADDGTLALDPQVAYLITSILSDTSVRLSENLTIPGQINAAKTGTSNRQDPGKKYYPHDLWTVGYTTHLVAGVWTGNNRDDEGHIGLSADGTNVAAPIWKKFMTQALKDTPSESFPVPSGIKQITVATASGKLPGPNTPADQQKTDVFADFAIPTEIDDSYSQVNLDTRNGKLSNEFCPADFVKKQTYVNLHDISSDYGTWQIGVNEWLQAHNGEIQTTPGSEQGVIMGAPPIAISELCTSDKQNNQATIEILAPTGGSSFAPGSNVEVKVNINASQTSLGIEKVEFYLDDKFQYFSDKSPYTGTVRLPKGETGTTHHTITAKIIDKLGYGGKASIDVVISKDGSPTPVPATPDPVFPAAPDPATIPAPTPSSSPEPGSDLPPT